MLGDQLRIASHDFYEYMARANAKGLIEYGDIMAEIGTNTGAARCARDFAPNALRDRQRSRGETHRKTCVLGSWDCEVRTHLAVAARFASSPRSLLGRDDRGLLDLADNGELVLDCEVCDQYPHGLAAIA